MGITMRTWDVAKVLMQSCKSPEEVAEVITILKDPMSIDEVCSRLRPFSDLTSDVMIAGSNATANKKLPGNGDALNMPTATTKPGSRHLDPALSAAVGQLEVVFRAKGMTNNDVERWVTTHFDVRGVLGKDSLRKYLYKILKNSDLSFQNRLLASAQQLVTGDKKGVSDLEQYWEKLDNRNSSAP